MPAIPLLRSGRELERILAGERVVLEYPPVADKQIQFIAGFVFRLLAHFNVGFLSELTLVCLREIFANCSKANAKRIYFDEKGLKLGDAVEYQRGMRHFSADVLSEWDSYQHRRLQSNYYIRFSVVANASEILFQVENNVQILPVEWDRIKSRIQSYLKYRDINKAFSELRDESEGAGLGIFLILSLLENAGIQAENYRLQSKDGVTINELRIPLPLRSKGFEQDFYNRIEKEIESLPAYPEHVSRIMQLCDSDGASMQVIAGEISRDPSLTAEVLRLVHSAGYIRYNRNPGIAEAVKVLGINVIRNILLVTGARNVLERQYRIKDLEQIWEESNRISWIARRVSRGKQQAQDMAAVAGLLSQLGRIVLVALRPEVWKTITRAVNSGRIRNPSVLEESLLGISHAEIGAFMGEKWQFPEQIVSCIRYQFRPLAAPQEEVEWVWPVYAGVALNAAILGQADYYSLEAEALDLLNISNEEQFKKLTADLEQGFRSKS
ncbi:MAG: HDOD domain-containing protein [Leptospirales bacterium]|nr:HDOD domain-containing protein [Leptospirales bacterium]